MKQKTFRKYCFIFFYTLKQKKITSHVHGMFPGGASYELLWSVFMVSSNKTVPIYSNYPKEEDV